MPISLLDFTTNPLADALATVQAGRYASAHPDLSDIEKALIYHYTDTGSQPLNLLLHAQAGRNTTPLGQELAAAVARLPPYQGLVYSAAFWQEEELRRLWLQAAAGSAFALDEKRWPAFLSASKSLAVARQHLNYSPKNCLLFINSKTGRSVEALSRYGPNGPDPYENEREVLFLPRTRFRLLAVRSATTYLEIELLGL